jgi:hypothetical protein
MYAPRALRRALEKSGRARIAAGSDLQLPHPGAGLQVYQCRC